ncbi:hypothetical protein [Actinomadura sp. 3N407]|uniref:hypothetical protein n=1 Tax=Actinomadura sp. 3N407 TaxID=3457423 RepID=UPI003FCEC065
MYRTHEMRMVRAEQSGHEEWACPTCGRRILLRWPPDYDKQIIEPGDEKACHVGSAADTPPEPDAPPADTTADMGEPGGDTSGDTSGDTGVDEAAAAQSRNGGRWLRETGMDTYTAPVSPP